MPPILRITDGTAANTIDLLQQPPGFLLLDWRPTISVYKAGGVHRGSPLSDGERLVDKKFSNVFETIRLRARDVSQNALVADLQNLRRLLELASSYWATDWQNTVVYLEARSAQESLTRYAAIVQGRVVEDPNPYSQPFLTELCESAADQLTLILERGHWAQNPPGVGTPVELSALEDFDNRALGNVDNAGVRDPTINDEVFVSNKRSVANLSDIFYWDGVGGAWSGNLMDAGLPFDLYQNPVAVDDVVIFGIDTTIADSGPFCSLVFDLLTAQNDLTITWRYSQGGADPTAWPALAGLVTDNTNTGGQPLDTVGVNSVHWDQPANWAAFNPAVGVGPAVGVTALWVCAHVTAVGATPTPPEQQNRDIYSITWPYVEVQAAQVGGDILALNHLTFRWQLAATGRRFVMGLRSMNRGADFTAYLNFSNEQNPAGISVTAGANTGFVADLTTPTGVALQYNPPGAQALAARGTINIGTAAVPATAAQYVGKFHVFFRFKAYGAATGFTTRLRLIDLNGVLHHTSQTIVIPLGGSTDYGVVDFGVLRLAPFSKHTALADTGRFSLIVDVSAGNGVDSIDLVDLVLIPVDEWAGDFEAQAALLGSGVFAEFDSISSPKDGIQSPVWNATPAVSTACIQRTNGLVMWQANERQRLWFFVFGVQVGGRDESDMIYSATVLSEKNQQYLSMRGAR